MTSAEITVIITAIGTVAVQVIQAFFAASGRKEIKDQVKEVHDKANEIKDQTDGNHSEVLAKLQESMNENKALAEKNVTLEKAMIALAAGNQTRQVRASDVSMEAKDGKSK